MRTPGEMEWVMSCLTGPQYDFLSRESLAPSMQRVCEQTLPFPKQGALGKEQKPALARRPHSHPTLLCHLNEALRQGIARGFRDRVPAQTVSVAVGGGNRDPAEVQSQFTHLK